MLGFRKQYNSLYGVFLTFNKSSQTIISGVSHNFNVMTNFQKTYNYTKYESYTSSKFSLTVLYIMFKYRCSSINSLVSKLNDLDFKEVNEFHNKILHYEDIVIKTNEYLISKYNTPTYKDIINEYTQGNIEWYSCWFILKYMNKLEVSLQSPLFSSVLLPIQTVLLYIKFSESSTIKIGTLRYP